MRKPGMSLWGAILVAGVVVLGWQAVLMLAAAIQAWGQGTSLAQGQRVASLEPLNLALAEAAASLAAVWIGLRIRGDSPDVREALAIEPVGLGVGALALVAGVATHFPLTEVENLLRELHPLPLQDQLRLRQLITPHGAWDALAIAFAFVVVAPLTEELVFRGTILTGLAQRHRPGIALVLSSVLFGAAHLEPVAVVYASIAGLLLGAVAIRTRSILPSIAMHAGINSVPILLPARLVRIPGVNTLSAHVYHVPLALLLPMTVVAVAALLALMWLSDREEH